MTVNSGAILMLSRQLVSIVGQNEDDPIRYLRNYKVSIHGGINTEQPEATPEIRGHLIEQLLACEMYGAPPQWFFQLGQSLNHFLFH